MARDFISASSQKVSCGDISELNGVATLSIGGWFKRDASLRSCVGKGDGNNTRMYILLNSDGRIYSTVRNGSSNFVRITNTSTDWQHVILTYNGGEGTPNDRIKLYLNGVLQSPFVSGTHPTTSDSNTAEYELGIIPNSSDYDDGNLAEQKVWSSTLTGDEVLSDYYGTTPDRVNLVSHWPLGWGSPEPDMGGNYPGTLSNTPALADHPPVPMPFNGDFSHVPYTVASAGGFGGLLSTQRNRLVL